MSKQALLSFFLVLSSLIGLEAGALRDKGPEYSQLSEQFTWFSNVRQSRKAGRTIIESGQKLPQPLNLSKYSHPGSECVSPSTCSDDSGENEEPNSFKSKVNVAKENTQAFFRKVGNFFKSEN